MATPEDEQNVSHYLPVLADPLSDIQRIPTACAPSQISEHLEPAGSTPDELSERELDVLRYLSTMLTASEIAAELYISVNAVKAHTRYVYTKLGASRRQDAVLQAYRHGML
jgi:DNA-binding NarL/FixJ family response regulator